MLKMTNHAFFALLLTFVVSASANEAEVPMPQLDFTSPFSVYKKIVRVYDGDTITIEADNGNKVSLRLVGVNTPEIKGKTAEEKARAIDARDWLREMILNKHVFILFEESGKTLDGIKRGRYCRPLIYVFIRDESAKKNIFVNLELVWQGHGDKYFKEPFAYEKFFKLDEEIARKRIAELDLSKEAEKP